jgi:hypothetical protein
VEGDAGGRGLPAPPLRRRARAARPRAGRSRPRRPPRP